MNPAKMTLSGMKNMAKGRGCPRNAWKRSGDIGMSATTHARKSTIQMVLTTSRIRYSGAMIASASPTDARPGPDHSAICPGEAVTQSCPPKSRSEEPVVDPDQAMAIKPTMTAQTMRTFVKFLARIRSAQRSHRRDRRFATPTDTAAARSGGNQRRDPPAAAVETMLRRYGLCQGRKHSPMQELAAEGEQEEERAQQGNCRSQSSRARSGHSAAACCRHPRSAASSRLHCRWQPVSRLNSGCVS